ncbi:hypothetical protein DKW60_00305 [Leucothrix pacifica]|uniref:Uncharacterized protein n=1 Tax=Leucothrix pacifica TaxID=1247513 RepID=A0A317CQL7_9GAMM|nr:hypothetical protein DKW60_00305 [Leucothrix pacifica]
MFFCLTNQSMQNRPECLLCSPTQNAAILKYERHQRWVLGAANRFKRHHLTNTSALSKMQQALGVCCGKSFQAKLE